jgi:hypothetical protein
MDNASTHWNNTIDAFLATKVNSFEGLIGTCTPAITCLNQFIFHSEPFHNGKASWPGSYVVLATPDAAASREKGMVVF